MVLSSILCQSRLVISRPGREALALVLSQQQGQFVGDTGFVYIGEDGGGAQTPVPSLPSVL